jgi:predicted SnoaL-like aldol condensation-catalyzing enzyme
MTNKESAVTFLQMAARGEIVPAYERFVAANFKHHNQYFAGDRQSLLTAMQEAAVRMPEKTFDIQHVYEAGETLITHALLKPQPEHPGIAVVHILRFEAGKIAEMWDVGQALSPDSPNEHGAF